MKAMIIPTRHVCLTVVMWASSLFDISFISPKMAICDENLNCRRSEIHKHVPHVIYVSQRMERCLFSFLSFTFLSSLRCATFERATREIARRKRKESLSYCFARFEERSGFAQKAARVFFLSRFEVRGSFRERNNRASLYLRIYTSGSCRIYMTDSKLPRTEPRNDYEVECECLNIYVRQQ